MLANINLGVSDNKRRDVQNTTEKKGSDKYKRSKLKIIEKKKMRAERKDNTIKVKNPEKKVNNPGPVIPEDQKPE